MLLTSALTKKMAVRQEVNAEMFSVYVVFFLGALCSVSGEDTTIGSIKKIPIEINPLKQNATILVSANSSSVNSPVVDNNVFPTLESINKTIVSNSTLNDVKAMPDQSNATNSLRPLLGNVTILQKNLGENGTGIRRYKDCDPDKPICVSKPISAEEVYATIPEYPDSEEKIFSEHNITNIVNDTHYYYNSSMITDDIFFKNYWESMISSGELKIVSSVSNTHRRAVVLTSSFSIPFYGQPIENVTIATGGFVYMGDCIHNWLAATQFAAPLMANFDTSVHEDSNVKYIDNGTALSVIWENVTLEDNHEDGKFTFAVTLHNNGDIVFAYKDIPIPVDQIKNTSHPVKVGLSDAFIIDNIKILVQKKTIFEYNRVDFKDKPITNGSIIWLKALNMCFQYKTCQDCINHDTFFKCSWCATLNRCSHGDDRLRQEWTEKNCMNTNITQIDKCPAPNVKPDIVTEATTIFSTPKSTTLMTTTSATPTGPAIEKHLVLTNSASEGSNSAAVVTGLMALIVAVGLGAWFLYAYRNPHTYSGQLLIKIRPSQWRWRRGEARYTAATIHM